MKNPASVGRVSTLESYRPDDTASNHGAQASLDEYRNALASRMRDTGAENALGARDAAEWRKRAEEELDYLIAAGCTFTADDLPRSPSPGAVGGLIHAAKAGRIVMIGYATSTKPSRHGGLLRVWRAP